MVDPSKAGAGVTESTTRERLFSVILVLFGCFFGALLAAIITMFPPTPDRPQVVFGLAIATFVVGTLVPSTIGLDKLKKWGWITEWTTIFGVGPFIVLVLALPIGGYVTHRLIELNSVVVPGLVETSYAQALSELRDLGLTADPIIAAHSNNFTPVTRQRPLAGVKVMRGAAIELIVGVLSVDIDIEKPTDAETVYKEGIKVVGSSIGVAESGGRLHANILLQPLNADGYWIYGPLAIGNQGEWIKIINLGQGSGRLPQDYQILALVTMDPLKRQGSGDGEAEYPIVPRHMAKSRIVTVTRAR